MKLSGINYFIGRNLQEVKFRLMKFNHKLFNRIPNGRYLPLDLIRSGEAINTIFDVGANVGQTCLSLIKFFPKSKIYSFEPVTTTYNELILNTRKYPNITCVNMALGQKEERIQIAAHENSQCNSLKNTAPDDADGGIKIESTTAAVFCKSNNITHIDLLKIDVEGFEMEVLRGLDESFLRNNVKFIYAETGFDSSDGYKTHYSDMEHHLKPLGFVTSAFYDQCLNGKNHLVLSFCNTLFTNSAIL